MPRLPVGSIDSAEVGQQVVSPNGGVYNVVGVEKVEGATFPKRVILKNVVTGETLEVGTTVWGMFSLDVS